MALVADAIRDLQPDVVGLQEVREAPGMPNQAELLAAATSYQYAFAPAVAFGGGHEGLAILARHPIAEHAALELPHAEATERRILLSARLTTVAGELWVHTTHLNYRLAHGRQREDQVLAIDAAVSARAGGPQIVMGDFNARPESDEIRFMRGLCTLGERRTHYQDTWERVHPGESGWTWCVANPYTRALAFLEPDRRLDYIFVTPGRRDGRGRVLDCRVVLDRPAPDGVFASDHFGVVADVQVTASEGG
jgi:endonuclease/exonuclease/phosphatase family metal-dependent hydrolase